jgi:putative endonuclease
MRVKMGEIVGKVARGLFRRRFLAHVLGRLGEERAAWFYRLRGYRILARNVRFRSGEIDIVAQRGSMVVIAEVKTRQSKSAGKGYEAVTRRKRERLIRLAQQWAARRQGMHFRYDVVSIFWNGWRFVVTHIPDAFRPVADTKRPWILRA